MNVQAFIHRHYSPEVGESPLWHAAAVFAGLSLMAMGAALITFINVWIPEGTAIGLLGLLILGGGVFAHIQSPVRLTDVADAAIALAGAAIAMTLTLVSAGFLLAFGTGVVASLIVWIGNLP